MIEAAAIALLALQQAPSPPRAPEKPAAAPDITSITFKEVAKKAGIDCVNLSGDVDKPRIIDTLGGGMCWFDYDNDGWLDLFIPNGSNLACYLGKERNSATDHLYRNKGDGTFEDVTDKAGLHDDAWGLSANAGDFDNDGDKDLYVCNLGLNFLYRNNGDGTFTDIGKEAGVQFDGVTPGACWADVDLDGDLDLYVSAYIAWNRQKPLPPFAKTMRNMKVMFGPKGLRGETDKLFRNDGGGRFTDFTKEAGLDTRELDHGFTIQILDMDGDELPDIFVADDMTPNLFYKSVAKGKWKEAGLESGLAVDKDGKEQACMGIAIADLNGDQVPDYVITNFAVEKNAFYLSKEKDDWEDTPDLLEEGRSCKPYVKWGIGLFDFDRDADEDLLFVNGHVFPQVDGEVPPVTRYAQPALLYRNDSAGQQLKFDEVSDSAGDFPGERPCRGAGFADYDEDGDVDVAVVQIDKEALLFRNETASTGHFVKVQAEGTTCNRDGYGARITVEAGGKRFTRWVQSAGSFISQNDPRAHVGLGAIDRIDRITVHWPGAPAIQDDVVAGPLAADRTYVIKEGSGKVAELARGQVWARPRKAAVVDPPK